MHRPLHPSTILAAFALVGLAGAGTPANAIHRPPFAAGALAAQAAAPPTGEGASVVASGLVNPRGFEVAADGSLLVALAGAAGTTAGVAEVVDGCLTIAVDGLPSYRVVFAGPVGVADVARVGDETYALVAGGNIDGGGMPNGLYRLDGAGGVELVADISSFIRDNPVAERPGDYDTDGQPYALLPVEGGFWATEGNSNQILWLGFDGTVARVADLSEGHPIPTGIALAPDGGAYVGLFTSTPYEDGAAKVVAVTADGTVADYWTGLTLVTALAVGPDGALYALEMATGIDPADPASVRPGTGRVVRMTGPDSAEEVVTGLNLPATMEFGPDGALHVAGPAFGADEGQGTIVRIDLAGELPVAVSAMAPNAPACS